MPINKNKQKVVKGISNRPHNSKTIKTKSTYRMRDDRVTVVVAIKFRKRNNSNRNRKHLNKLTFSCFVKIRLNRGWKCIVTSQTPPKSIGFWHAWYYVNRWRHRQWRKRRHHKKNSNIMIDFSMHISTNRTFSSCWSSFISIKCIIIPNECVARLIFLSV